MTETAAQWQQREPFPHLVIDDFFENDLALRLERELPAFDDPIWHQYNNAIEVKKVCNNWNVFPQLTYSVFNYLNANEFVNMLSSTLLEGQKLNADPGLNGGGWHIHRRGGKLNTHLRTPPTRFTSRIPDKADTLDYRIW